MTDDRPPDRFSLSRWSRRKLESARAASAAPGSDAPAPTGADAGADFPTRPGTSAPATTAPATTAQGRTAQGGPTAAHGHDRTGNGHRAARDLRRCRRTAAVAADRLARHRRRLHRVLQARRRPVAAQRGAEEAVRGPALQRDGRAGHLHRRLFGLRAARRRGGARAGPGPGDPQSAENARERPGSRRTRPAGRAGCRPRGGRRGPAARAFRRRGLPTGTVPARRSQHPRTRRRSPWPHPAPGRRRLPSRHPRRPFPNPPPRRRAAPPPRGPPR